MITANNEVETKEGFKEHAHWVIKRYANDEDFKKQVEYSPEEARDLFGVEQETEFEPNILTNGGITEMLKLIATTGATKFDNANAYLGVGDSSTAESASQSALQGTTNKLFKAMDSTYPQVSGTSCTWQSTFASGEANFAWNEFGVANTSAGTVLLNRKVSSQGTKQSGQTWTLQLAITLS